MVHSGLSESGMMDETILELINIPHWVFAVLEFFNNLWGLGTEKEWGCRTGPPGYTTQPGGIGSLESILGFLISLKIRAQDIPHLISCRGKL
jgi:hypothetical protein